MVGKSQADLPERQKNGAVAELVYAHDLKSCVLTGHVGSTPTRATKTIEFIV